MDLRDKLLKANGCAFTAIISADYGENIYTFQMECTADAEGNLTFQVIEPETISGIKGRISQVGGALTFDDHVLAFPLLADGQLTPVCAPWIWIRALRSGYISGCGIEEKGTRIYYDDSFENAVVRLEVLCDKEMIPLQADIFWEQRRILSVEICKFTFL